MPTSYLSFQSLQEYPKLREALLPSLDVISFQSLQEYPKLLDAVLAPAFAFGFQSLQEYPKQKSDQRRVIKTLVSNPYRNILSSRSASCVGTSIPVSNPYRNILSLPWDHPEPSAR